MADYAKDVVVEPDWLEQHLNDDWIRIVEVDENPDLYRKAHYREAHIPGAIVFDWKLDLQDPVKRDFLSAEDFGKLLGSRGVKQEISCQHSQCKQANNRRRPAQDRPYKASKARFRA